MSLEVATKSRNGVISSFSVSTILILAFSVLWCVFWFVHSWNYWEDDAYIHLEFARSLATHHGFAFNGHITYGDTAPLWVFLLVGVHCFIPDYMIAGKLLAAIGAVFTLTGAYVFSRRLSASRPYSETFAAAMVLLIVLNPYFCYWAFSGMETVTAVGLTLWCLVAATSDPPSWSRLFVACILAGIAPLMRPEMVFLSGLLSILLIYQWYMLSRGRSSLHKLGTFILGLILAAGPTLLWAIYAMHTFGRVIPNTNAAKRAAADASVPIRLLSVYSLGFPLIMAGLLAGLIYLLLNFSTLTRTLKSVSPFKLPAAATWVFGIWSSVAAVFYVMDHTLVQTRYILVTAMGLMIVVLAIVRTISFRTYSVFLLAGLIVAIGVSCCSVWPFIRNKSVYCAALSDLATFIRSELPPDAPVADYAIGELAYLSQHPIIDTGGITRPEVAPFMRDPVKVLAWIHTEGAVYYLVEEKPEPGAVLVYEKPVPVIGWYLNYHRYSGTDRIRLWRLNTTGDQTTTAPAHP